MTCNKHPEWKPTGLEWRCPHCSVPARTKPLTAKQRVRVAAAGSAVRLDDLSGGAWDAIRKRIRERDGYRCRRCSVAVRTGVVDHVKPLEHGGTNEDGNLQLLCVECHRKKTARDRGYVLRDGSNEDGMPKGSDHHWNR
ncbi:HNH endonuclease [Paraburkholderia sediminicola]|uniref:HNH endonuclease n=1 Tax=Paraburkholderia sediminicola TaxID=458836 RepID=UPI0038B8FC4A